jgi:acyl carrier protein
MSLATKVYVRKGLTIKMDYSRTFKTTALTVIIAAGAIQWGCAYKTTSQNAPANNKQEPATRPDPTERQHIQDKITEIVARQLGIEPGSVDVNLPLSKLKVAADELDVVEIIMRIEEELDIEIKDEEIDDAGDITQSLSVKKLVEIVAKNKNV